MGLLWMREEYDKNYAYGLKSKEAEERLHKYGYNEIVKKKRVSPVIIFLSQFGDFIVWILIGAAIISYFMRERADAITILIIVIMDAVLGFIQEYKTERSLEALKELAAPTARVIRDGSLITIKAREIVIGDIIEVEAGDKIPADCIIIQGEGLQSDESILTGESLPVEKISYSGRGKVLGKNIFYMGCSVTHGRGRCRVIAAGMDTEMGKIASMLQEIETSQTPLQRKLNNLGKVLVIGCIIICAIVTAVGILRGEDIYKMFLIGISLAVAAIPEGLPAVVTVSLAIGVQRMMKNKALVRKLPAVETLGCTNIICSDKTGTLTQNKMTVKKIYISGNYYEVTGDGYSIKGDIKYLKQISELEKGDIKKLIECVVLCNNASIPEDKDKKKKYFGDPTEIALLVMGAKFNTFRGGLIKNNRLIKENPFDSERKMMSVVYNKNGSRIMYAKGAPEKILNKCTHTIIKGEVIQINDKIKKSILNANDNMAQDALRVIAAAYKEIRTADSILKEDRLIFIGLTGMIDPPRIEVKDAIIECRTAGIIPIMITGDHKLTAYAIAKQLRMLDDNGVVITGEEIDKMSDSQLDRLIERVRVFARVNPSHKYRIVKALKKKNYVVAMTGDGVNDAPAIKEADIGISMGISGTDVTKEASSMILLNDNFATIVGAVREGRIIYDNIRKFIRYLLSCNIGEVLTMFVSALMGLPVPLLPIQILLVNLATDGLPAMALSLEPGEDDVMIRKPRKRDESVFSDGLWKKIILRGFLIGLCTVVAFSMSLVIFGGNIRLSSTIALCTLVMSQLFHVFECKSERHSVFKAGIFTNKYLTAAVISSVVLLILTVYSPWLQTVFKTQALNLVQWGIVLAFSGTVSIVSSLFWYRK